MILKKVNFFEYEGQPNYWKIRNVGLGDINLIVGYNATGKTRLMNIISNLAKILMKKRKPPTEGSWSLEFKTLDKNEVYAYDLLIKNKIIEKEEIKLGGEILLQRVVDEGTITSCKQGKIDINPPKEELVLNIRRDKAEFPFLEELYYWADNFYGYTFTSARPTEICIPSTQEGMLENLNTVPYILIDALQDPQIKKAIIKDFCDIGYPVSEVKVKQELISNLPPGIFFVELQEKDLKCPTKQVTMSQGMFRAFALVVIIEYILKMNKYCTVAIDDLGEGLDYDRATKITQLLFNKVVGSKIQLLVTSNDRFLINNTNIEYLNILERHHHVVDSFNYINSKEKFEEFKSIGLNTFDFFTGKMYKENPNEKN